MAEYKRSNEVRRLMRKLKISRDEAEAKVPRKPQAGGRPPSKKWYLDLRVPDAMPTEIDEEIPGMKRNVSF